ncbi:hypothetical protein GCM10009780_70510 [Actinomadura alba]
MRQRNRGPNVRPSGQPGGQILVARTDAETAVIRAELARVDGKVNTVSLRSLTN